MATVPFAFVPRIVSKHAKPWQGISGFPPSPSSSSSPDHTTDSEPGDGDGDGSDDPDAGSSSEPDKGKIKEKAIELAQSKQSTLAQDIASLISLALSDYNIWLDSDLRSKLDACLNDDASPVGAGFVPINYLLRRAPFRGSLPPVRQDTAHHPGPSEGDVVKALRTHASHTLEVRMCLPSTTSSVWYGTGKTARKKDVGGYEVRRKDWSSLHARPWTRARWDDMTIYMEGIPPAFRTLGGIARFAERLLPPEADAARLRIQHVSLPPHYLDKPGDVPKCKGYALITCSTPSHAEALLRAWPWIQRRERVPKDDEAPQIVKDALKYGLRALSKTRWDALNEEYLAYKQSLVDEINAYTTETHADLYPDKHGDEPQMQRRTTTVSSYPLDCLVFVRDIHPETNKTTLKVLFGRAFQDDVDKGAQSRPGGVGIDYVDFNKGMDTCYLRLASPQHATRLVAYFNARRTAQASGLDAIGRTPVQDERSVAVEMIQGTKEALYWERVPEQVRRQAVDKAIRAGAEPPTVSTNIIHGGKQKKRTRKP